MKKVRFKTFTYEIDLEQEKVKQPEIKFTGNWSRTDLDRMFKLAARALRQHKAKQLKEYKDEQRREESRGTESRGTTKRAAKAAKAG